MLGQSAHIWKRTRDRKTATHSVAPKKTGGNQHYT